MGLILKLIFFLVSGAFIGAVVLGALGVFLVVTGSPDTCDEPNVDPLPPALLATQLDLRWAVFSAESMNGPASITVTEAEATARGRQYLDTEDVPLDDFQVYFCDGDLGQLAGTVEALGIDVKFVVTAHLDVSGAEPVVELDSVDVGNMPGFVSDAIIDLFLDDQTRTLELTEHLTGTEISDGQIVINGEP